MYRNLNPDTLKVSGRQSELIELALTYRFKGLDVDVEELARRITPDSLEGTRQIFDSAKIHVGGFQLPIGWRAEEAQYELQKTALGNLIEIAGGIGVEYAVSAIHPDSHLPYHEDFELHRQRISEVADMLAEKKIRLGLELLSAPSHRAGTDAPFIHQVDTFLTLLKTISHEHVGLILDVWNWIVGGGTVEQIADLDASQIVSLQLADLPADADLALVSESKRLLPGQGGGIDCAAVLKTVAANGFDGPVSICPAPDQVSGLTRDNCVLTIQKAMDELWEAAELNPASSSSSVPVAQST